MRKIVLIIYVFMHSLGCWKFFFFLLEEISEVLRKAGWPVLRICIFTPCQCIRTELSRLILVWSSPCSSRTKMGVTIPHQIFRIYGIFIFDLEPRNFWHLTGRWNISMMHPVSYEESWQWYAWDDATLTGQLVPLGERFSCTFFNTHHDVCLYWS